jgi:ABC-type glycerol-3-phosphate transport system substrate-binding protein
MKKVIAIAAAGVMSLGLVACSGDVEVPTPTVTVTEESLVIPETTQESTSSSQDYITHVNTLGGIYALVASDSDILEIGNVICDGFTSGLSEDDIIEALVVALIENDLGDDDGTTYAAALLSGAKIYLCPNAV